MDIKNIIKVLIYRHKTNNPFELADELEIDVLYEDLGDINGYYNTAYGSKFIHINKHLKGHRRTLTTAHELGHAIMHPTMNTPFMREHTYFSVNKYEIEANTFAVHLLIPDSELVYYKEMEYTKQQLAVQYGVPLELIELRFRVNDHV